MIRALYTAATGMAAQQAQIDTTSNNLANVNTTGFKKDRAEFKDLIYQNQNYTAGATSSDTVNPTGINVGLGVRLSNINKLHMQGSLKETGNTLDVAITGKGFFKIELPNGDINYTRDGSFKLNPEGFLVNGQGFKVSPDVGPITNEHIEISIAENGELFGRQEDGQQVSLGQLTLTYFPNPAGLIPEGNNMFLASDASGEPMEDLTPGTQGVGRIQQGFLEGSNVQLVTEMMDLISAQRAYEANSKSVTTVDEMLSTANNLKR
jgi:flagellar basal-body rod protein FlgG